MKHTTSAQTYINDFELALTQVGILPEHTLSIFLSSLEHHTQMHVRMFNPTTLARAENLAKLHESSKPATLKQTTYKPAFYNPKPNTQLNRDRKANQKPLLNNNPNQKPVFNRTNKILSNAAMEERRAKGLCWYCDEPFAPGHHLKHQGK